MNASLLFIATSLVTLAVSGRAEIALQATAEKIDALLLAKLQKEKIQPLPPVSDETFVRRIYLDIAGRIPSLTETQTFLEDKATDKRPKLIDQLLASASYEQNMFNYWADVLRFKTQITNGGFGIAGGEAYRQWLRSAIATNKPFDQMVRELISAKGKTYENGAVGFYLRDFNMQLDNMAVATQVFLGTSMVCAQCHNHPFDKWSQLDYYQMAAHTYGVTGQNNSFTNPLLEDAMNGLLLKSRKPKQGKANRRQPISTDLPEDVSKKDIQRAVIEILQPLRFNTLANNSGKRTLLLPHDYQYSNGKPKQSVEPTIPVSFSDSGKISPVPEQSPQAYAEWMTSKENPRFTTVITNRLWKKLMGQAFIEPLDEMTDSIVPSNPELLAYLEQVMKDVGYDMKAFLRVVLNTQAYQRDAFTADVELGTQYHFPGPLLRRMSAEQIWDSMVVLYKSDVDSSSDRASIVAEARLRRVEWMDRSLNALSPEELKQSAIDVARQQKVLTLEVQKAQRTLVAANESKDEKAIREAKLLIKSQRQAIYDAAEKAVFDIGIKKFNQLVKEGRLLEISKDPAFNSEVKNAFKAKKVGESLTLDEAVDLFTQRRQKAYEQTVAKRSDADAQRFRLEGAKKDESKSFREWEKNRESIFIRAVDMNHPAPNGHFLRSFGQSDREIVENANDEASISQALMLLNGRVFAQLMNPYTQISRAMSAKRKEGPDALIDVVYLSLFSRRASAEEKAILREVADKADSQDRGDVLWTALNTRQFFFIQ